MSQGQKDQVMVEIIISQEHGNPLYKASLNLPADICFSNLTHMWRNYDCLDLWKFNLIKLN